eukprot:1161680-Pelagomonas_calceolata.AAC.2
MELVRAGVRREQVAPHASPPAGPPPVPWGVQPAYSSDPSEAGGEASGMHGDTATSPPHRRCVRLVSGASLGDGGWPMWGCCHLVRQLHAGAVFLLVYGVWAKLLAIHWQGKTESCTVQRLVIFTVVACVAQQLAHLHTYTRVHLCAGGAAVMRDRWPPPTHHPPR